MRNCEAFLALIVPLESFCLLDEILEIRISLSALLRDDYILELRVDGRKTSLGIPVNIFVDTCV